MVLLFGRRRWYFLRVPSNHGMTISRRNSLSSAYQYLSTYAIKLPMHYHLSIFLTSPHSISSSLSSTPYREHGPCRDVPTTPMGGESSSSTLPPVTPSSPSSIQLFSPSPESFLTK